MFFTIIVFIITLLVLVVSHEFGHFIAAKKFGIGVLEFGFGLPPRVWGKKWGETLVSLNLLPLGGFVRLMGEDETDKKVLKNKSSFAVKPVWQRIIVVVAGVVMNLVLAAVIFYIVLFAQGFKEQIPLLSPYKFAAVDQINEALVFIGGVTPDAPADKGGIKSGDQVLKFNETKVVSGEQLVSLTKDYVGKEVSLTLKSSESQERVVKVTPRANPPAGQGALGVEIGTATVANLNYETLPQKLFSGFTHSYNLTSYSVVVLGSFIRDSFASRSLTPVSGSLAGPVGITNIAGIILKTESPLIPYLSFTAMISLNLAIINILPFPALDGGRLLFLSIEAIFRRKVKAEVERWVHTVGMAILLALIILVTFSDIKKFF